jgi:hypothetical protein
MVEYGLGEKVEGDTYRRQLSSQSRGMDAAKQRGNSRGEHGKRYIRCSEDK